MIYGNNNILNMLGINNQYSMYSNIGYGNNCGGYNNFNIFGNYSSYGNGCCDFNYDKAAGFMLGQSLIGIAFAAIGSLTGDSKTNSKEALTANAETLNAQIKTELGKIGKGITESNYATHEATDESWYKNGIASADNTININKQIMNSLEANIDTDRATVANYSTAKAKLDAEKDTATDPTEIAKINNQLATLKRNFDEADERVKKYDEAKSAHDKAVTDKEALETEAKSEQEKIDKIAEKITELIQKRDNVQGNLDAKKLDKADGNFLTRVSEDKFSEKVKYNEQTGDAIVTGEVSIRYARLAVKKYSVAQKTGDKNGMKQAKAEFLAIYNKLDANDKDRLTDAYNLLK